MIVETIINEKLSIWFDQNPSVARAILIRLFKQLWQEMWLEKQEKMLEEKELRVKWCG